MTVGWKQFRQVAEVTERFDVFDRSVDSGHALIERPVAS
jgi:hypothetical protein